VFATDPESTRYALGGVLVELTNESIAMVGTDGRRLARAMAAATVEGDWQAPVGTPVIPVKALKLIERNLDDADPPVHIMIRTASEVLVRTERSIIYSRLLEGRFPRYQDAFPKSAGVRIPLEVEEFRRTIEQAMVATDDDSRGVDFSFREGLLKLSSQAANVGSSQVETPVSYSGPQLDLKYDPRYLLDALKTLDGVESATLEVIDHKSAAVLRTDDGYTYLIMPLSREA
jgi:DNA polymerase-3 subunit beta